MIVPDTTGIEWRVVAGIVQHRYGSGCFANRRPGPWITTQDVDRIVHPERLAAIAVAQGCPEEQQ